MPSPPASLQYPSYYTLPFHAYPEGNLAMEPALEMTVAARRCGRLTLRPGLFAVLPVLAAGASAAVLLVGSATASRGC